MLNIIHSIPQWRELRKNFVAQHTIGFVPTMGNLHQGHLSLLQKSVAENDITVLSIFVNPTQFNNPEDFKKYPQTFSDDCQLAEKLGIHYLLAPSYEELYPDHYSYRISESQLSPLMEGQYRPGHFDGMLTIVMKLLLLVLPNKAYFGEKDYQQLQLIKGLVKNFFIDTEIIACPTIRENSGLPYSSRNNLLSSIQRQQAQQFPEIFQSNLSCQEIADQLKQRGFSVDYVIEHFQRRFAAVKLDHIRLIDNISLDEIKKDTR
ncbi:MAG: pantoate--beta-alanine ligase [Gammaproteobacteria bacterium]